MNTLGPIVLPYRGRFAPTPSGPLHLGSLLTALASWLQARANAGKWLLRVDDLDTARCVPGAAAFILGQLDAHGLHWDDAPRYQSQFVADYAETLNELRSKAGVYACTCTRAELKQRSAPGMYGPVYDGHCRSLEHPQSGAALRVALPARPLPLGDALAGSEDADFPQELGDFVVRRSDGVIGYQLACVVDERGQAITEVVRGKDLLASSLRQQWLMQTLGWPPPRYRHLPVIASADGRKLSKQNHAAAIDARHAADNLFRCLRWLGQNPPEALRRCTVSEVLNWALPRWDWARIPVAAQLQVEGSA